MDALTLLNQAEQAALLSGILGVSLQNGTYKNGTGKTTTFFLSDIASQIPAANYINGAISTYSMAKSLLSNEPDGNTRLFNTIVTSGKIAETFRRKGHREEIPFQNYDIPINGGIGGQDIVFSLVFTGTQYLKAYYNAIEVLFDASDTGLGTLTHPFYGVINNCLPRRVAGIYEAEKLNCIVFDVIFETSDISHLNNPTNTSASIGTDIAEGFMLAQQAAFAITSAISNIKGLINQVSAI